MSDERIAEEYGYVKIFMEKCQEYGRKKRGGYKGYIVKNIAHDSRVTKEGKKYSFQLYRQGCLLLGQLWY